MRQIPDKIDSKFRFVLLASKRAEQMMRGAQAMVEMPGAKQTQVAMHEILDEAVSWDYGPAPEAVAEAAEGEAVAADGETEGAADS